MKTIDKIFVLAATATLVAGLVFVLVRAFYLEMAARDAKIEMSLHGLFATIVGVSASVALGVLLTMIFVKGRRGEVADAKKNEDGG